MTSPDRTVGSERDALHTPVAVLDERLMDVQVQGGDERARSIGRGKWSGLPATRGQPQRRVLELRLRWSERHRQLAQDLGVSVQRVAGLAPVLVGELRPRPHGTRIGRSERKKLGGSATFPSSDGVTLHADILRPKNLPAGTKTPVILSVGPYFNHSGQVGGRGPVQGTSYDPVGSAGPSDRFLDFIEGAKLMERGYSFVMVDLRGFGGSTGCLDWAGPGEQADVVNAVKWAASQPWSTGKVGMYGKSYDGVTGLIGANHRVPGLEAVVSQEPVYDLYRYLYGDGIRRLNSVLTQRSMT